MRKDIELVIFDLDGTLINLKVDWEGLKKVRKHKRDWRRTKMYELEYIDEAEPIERSVECVKELRRRGCKLAIFSSNMYGTVEQALTKLGIRDCFFHIVAANNLVNLKPDPEGLERIIKFVGIDKAKTLFIGNSWKDEEAGKRAKIQTLLLKEIKSLW